MENIKIIGTSHISAESVNEVKKEIETFNPDIVAIELDHRRLHALFEEKRKNPGLAELREYGITGFLFAIIGGWAQQKLGNVTGVAPGSEMKTAYIEAKQKGLKVALIDQDFQITLKKLSKEFTFKEKMRILGDLITGIFAGKNQLKKMGMDFDLEKVPEKKIIQTVMVYMKKRYPNLHKVLVEDRNKVMCINLYKLHKQNEAKKILAVVGAGHEEEMNRILKKMLERQLE